MGPGMWNSNSPVQTFNPCNGPWNVELKLISPDIQSLSWALECGTQIHQSRHSIPVMGPGMWNSNSPVQTFNPCHGPWNVELKLTSPDIQSPSWALECGTQTHQSRHSIPVMGPGMWNSNSPVKTFNPCNGPWNVELKLTSPDIQSLSWAL